MQIRSGPLLWFNHIQIGAFIWPALKAVNFTFIPGRLRAIYVAIFSFFWTTGLAALKHSDHSPADFVNHFIVFCDERKKWHHQCSVSNKIFSSRLEFVFGPSSPPLTLNWSPAGLGRSSLDSAGFSGSLSSLTSNTRTRSGRVLYSNWSIACQRSLLLPSLVTICWSPIVQYLDIVIVV